jgi:hypothetical protein
VDTELLLGHRVTSTEEIKQVLKAAYHTPAPSEKPQFLMEGSLDQDFVARFSERLIENSLRGIYIPLNDQVFRARSDDHGEPESEQSIDVHAVWNVFRELP